MTTYGYDLLDDLTGVTQATQTRTFTYNALKQLITATNPENGTICYGTKSGSTCTDSYDGNGNLLNRIDNAGRSTTYTYDAVNRLHTKSYSDGTPGVTFTYDAASSACPPATPGTQGTPAYNVGRVTQVTTVAGGNSPATSENLRYDALGRSCFSDETVGSSGPYTFAYQYNLASGLKSETYPSQRIVTTTFDGQNRPSGVASGSATYVNSVTYASSGAPSQIKFGRATAPIATQTVTFDKGLTTIREQPTQINVSNSTTTLLTLNYGYCSGTASSCSNNNGNVASEGIVTPTLNLLHSFGYDLVNRLTSVGETGGPQNEWSQTYNYDQWGNRAVTSSFIPNAYATPTALTQYSNNQWQGSGVSYDPAGTGNQISLPARTFAYDAENRLITATQPNTGAIQYAYDGAGRRVMKTVGTTSTVFVYDGIGQLAAEYGVPPTAAGTEYVVSDTLGSTRLLLTSTGSVGERFDYLPFGEELEVGIGGRTSDYGSIVYPAAPDQQDVKFTSKERDAETGLDFFGARYFSSAQGRFTSPDWSAAPQPVPYADLRDPQTLNLYAYVRNNPLNRNDPDGHGFWQNLGNYLSYGVFGDEDAVKRAEDEARQRLVANQQQRASSGTAPMLYGTGKTDANGRPVYTTDPSQLSRSAVLNPTAVDLRLSTNVAAAGWLTAAGRATVTGGVYTLNDPITGQVMYVGRSSNLGARKSDWANDPEKGDLQFNVFRRTDSYPAQRGLEQKLYDQYNPPLNRIRPISPTNPNLQNYIRAAEELEDQ
jgi:RHS repeat-associated protein